MTPTRPAPTDDAPSEPEGCKGCRSLEPTVQVCFRQNVAKVVVLQISRIQGRYCFRCGRKWFRKMCRTTLIQGWWSPQSIVISPWLLGSNVVQYLRLRRGTGVRMSARERWRIAFGISVTLLALGVVAEGVCRIALEAQPGGPDLLFGRPLVPYPLPEVEDTDGGTGWLVPDRKRGWAPRPDARSTDGLHHTDALGLRVSARTEQPSPPAAKRVLLLGSEPAHSTGIAFDESLGRALERAVPGIEVLNGGVPGYGPGQTYLHLLEILDGLGEERAPHVAVVFLHPGDLEQALRVLPPGGPPGRSAWTRGLGFAKPRFRALGENDLSLVNLPVPGGPELEQALADYDTSPLAALDELRVPGAFTASWTDVSLLARYCRTQRARAAVDTTLASLHGAEQPSPAREVTRRIVGQMCTTLSGRGAAVVLVFAPDTESLGAARAGRGWWPAGFARLPGVVGTVDLAAYLARRASESHLPDAALVDPERRGALTSRGASLAAARLANPVGSALEHPPQDR